jgi:hypothetical protein
MGTIDLTFAERLRDRLGLDRAVETGTFQGATTRKLAGLFPSVVTIEISAELHARAARELADLPHVSPLQGNSIERLGELEGGRPTLYYLDGHWSGGETGGAEDECPVLRELAAIGAGHAADCIAIDDARLFMSAPPPPHNPEHWPSIVSVFDALRAAHPTHRVTVLDDQVWAVPGGAADLVDEYGWRLQQRDEDRRAAGGRGPAGRLAGLLRR